MEGEVFLMTRDGQLVTMVKIPEGTPLPAVIEWSDRLFVLKAGAFIEVGYVYKAPTEE